MSNSNLLTMGFDPASRKRLSGLPNPTPNKRPQRLSIGMDRLQIHNDEAAIGPQRTMPNIQPQSYLQQQPSSLQLTQQYLQRRSIMMNADARRSSSIFGRPNQTTSVMDRFNANVPLQTNKKFVGEPKHIKENDTQRRYLKSITEYLYETEYKGAKPPVNYRALGARDFQAMFKHLVDRLAPDYDFKKKFDEDVMEVIHQLNYPLADFFNQKHLLNIGAPHSIHVFYALLMWLTDMCKSQDDEDIEQDETDPLTQEQLFEAYSVECYHQFMDGNDDMSEQNKRLKELFDQFDEQNRRLVHNKHLSNMELLNQLDHLNSIKSPLSSLKVRNQDMKRDIEKFAIYMKERRAKIERYETVNQKAIKESKVLEEKDVKNRQDIEAIAAKFTARNTSLEEIEHLEFIYVQLQEGDTSVTMELEDAKKAVSEKELRLVKLRQEAETVATNYNNKIDNNSRMNNQVKITYNPDGTTIQQMLSYVDTDHDILPKLETISEQVKQEFKNTAEETMELREKSDTFNTKVTEQTSKLTAVEERAMNRKKYHEDKHLKIQEEIKGYNVMVDRHESKLAQKRERANELIFRANQALDEKKDLLRNVSQVIEVEQIQVTSKLGDALTEIVRKIEKMEIGSVEMHMKTDRNKDIVQKLINEKQ